MTPQERPLYSRRDIGRLIGMRSNSIARWYDGYSTRRNGKVIVYPAWMHQPKDGLLSFTDLIELWFVRKFQQHKVSLPRIRSTYKMMSERLKTEHPFLKKNLWIVASSSILAVDASDDPDAKVISDPESGQLYLDKIILEVGDKIEFDQDDFARRWFPLAKSKPVQVDPDICYGRPVVAGTRVLTSLVYSLWEAEEHNNEFVKSSYDLSDEQLQAALELERALRSN